MPSNYEGFYVQKEDDEGNIEAVASASVKVRENGGGSDLTTLTADSNGYIAAGSLSVAAGTIVHFRVENSGGLAGSVSQITT